MDYTYYLFARPSFLEGAARLFDMVGALDEYNGMPTPEEADALATWADWRAAGADIAAASAQFHEQVYLPSLADAGK